MPEELEDPVTGGKIIGSGSYGKCSMKTFLRLRIPVVVKELHNSDLADVYQEAYYMQLFSHRCVPHFLGVQVSSKPFAIIMEFLGHGMESLTVHSLLFEAKFKEIALVLCVL